MPYERGENPVAEKNIADDDTADTHLNAANVKRLLRVAGMSEPPYKSRNKDRGPARLEVFVQEGNRKRPRDKLLGDCRHKADQQHHDPRDIRVDHLAVGDVGRAPSTELLGCDVKEDLIGQKGGRHGQAENGAEEKALGAQARWRKLAPDLDLVGVVASVQRLGRCREKENEDALAGCGEQAVEQLPDPKRPVCIGGVVAKRGQRQVVELGQQG